MSVAHWRRGWFTDRIRGCLPLKMIGTGLMSLASSYLYKDVLAIDGIAKSSVLDKLIRALAFQIGQEVSYQKLGHLWENYVIAERFKANVNEPIPPRMFFWRTRTQQEIDYIEEDATGLSDWEMKWNEEGDGLSAGVVLFGLPECTGWLCHARKHS